MSYRYETTGYGFVLPADRLESDSEQTMLPLFYLFDTADSTEEENAERYLAQFTSGDVSTSGLMYESKASTRADFESFQQMFLLLGWLVPSLMYRESVRRSIVEKMKETE